MRFRFIGKYTNGHTSINACGVVFEGHEPREVPPEAVARLSGNVEFEAVGKPPADNPDKPKRGRPKKVVQ